MGVFGLWFIAYMCIHLLYLFLTIIPILFYSWFIVMYVILILKMLSVGSTVSISRTTILVWFDYNLNNIQNILGVWFKLKIVLNI